MPAAKRTSAPYEAQLRLDAPVTQPRCSRSSACGSGGACVLSTSAATPLARHTSSRWPSRPKPVTSVIACTPSNAASGTPTLFRRVVDWTICR
ncbi:hypothetical protein G6F59_015747 [Rhizopus arrhizus]|nr:hypothetical protein G6F59_015747 [Rhizopus arrhizus]